MTTHRAHDKLAQSRLKCLDYHVGYLVQVDGWSATWAWQERGAPKEMHQSRNKWTRLKLPENVYHSDRLKLPDHCALQGEEQGRHSQ